MSRVALVLRPEPGNAATAARLTLIGVAVRCRPLFATGPVSWLPPDPASYDALLLTSANAVRHAGPGLARVAALPVLAVGAATARAAEAAGLAVALTGTADAAALVAAAAARGFGRLLHLAGRERGAFSGVETITVYAADPTDIAAGEIAAWTDHVALLHSPRAARRFATLVDEVGVARDRIGVAALSPAVADAAGDSWRAAVIADAPRDDRLIAAAATLIDPPGTTADKRA